MSKSDSVTNSIMCHVLAGYVGISININMIATWALSNDTKSVGGSQ